MIVALVECPLKGGDPFMRPPMNFQRSVEMPRCDNCGNDYDKSFTVTAGGKTHTFDSFECAIYMLAPTCSHCRCRIIGHGVEASGQYFCCAHCAKSEGIQGVDDRVLEPGAEHVL